MFAMLDESLFTLKNGLSALELKHSAQFAEHAVFEGKPQTQALGMNLAELSLSVGLHYQRGPVRPRVEALVAMLESQKPVPLVMGNGRFVGLFVLMELVETSTLMDDRGGTLAAELSLSLTEFDGEIPPLATPPGILGDSRLGALGVLGDMVGGVLDAVNEVAATVQSAVDMANGVLATVDEISGMVQGALSGGLLESLTGLGGVLEQGLGMLNGISELSLPVGEVFSRFSAHVDQLGGVLGDMGGWVESALSLPERLPDLNVLAVLGDNLSSVAGLLNQDKHGLMVGLAGRVF